MSKHCPRCRSTDFQAVPITKTKGFSSGRGCLGLLFFGPLGLLFGLLGMGRGKTKIKLVCNNCGNRFD